MRLVRGVRRCCFAAASILAASSLLTPWVGAAEERPDNFASRAAATAVEAYFNTVPEQVIPEILRVDLPDADSQFDSNVGKSRASTLYPGLLVAQGGSLLGTAGAPVTPPPYPLSAYADHPESPDAKVTTGQQIPAGPLNVDAGQAEAHADDKTVTARAVNGRIDIAGDSSTAAAALSLRRQAAAILRGPLAAAAVRPAAADTALVHVDSSVAETSHVFQDGALIVKATSTLTGVRLLGGSISIDQIVSTATSRTDGETATSDRKVVISGAKVDNEPATIDENGVTVGSGTSGQGRDGIDQLNEAVADALTQAGFELRLLSATKKVEGAAADAAVEGLLLSARGGDTSNGFVSHVLLGKAGTLVAASPFEVLDEAGDALTGDAGAVTGLDAPVPPSGGDVALGPVDGGSGTPSTPAAPDRGTGGGATARPRLASVTDVTANRVEALYLALALAAFGLALGWRRILPSAARGS